MNPQGSKANPFGGIEWCHIFGPRTGYTVNPVKGCNHRCRWEMPDGNVVTCYAEVGYDRLHGAGEFQKVTFHPHVFEQIRAHQQPAGIFIDSMSDLFGEDVKTEDIQRVIDVMRECSRHVFFTLTKNPRRLLDFKFPNNVMVGMSTPPTFMYGKKMTPEQQQAWFRKGLEWLMQTDARNRWLSMEPLAVDVVAILEMVPMLWQQICFAVIGAGSDGAKLYQPDEEIFKRTLSVLVANKIVVFYKGNLSIELANKTGGWRDGFPALGRFKADAATA